MEAMISSRSLLPPTLRVCRRDRGEHEELWPPPWSPHRRGWSTPSAYSLWRSPLLFRSCGDQILPMCPSPTTSSSPGWPAWISPLLPSTSLPRARRSATMDPPAGGSREPAVLPCCSGEKVTWLSVHEEWSVEFGQVLIYLASTADPCTWRRTDNRSFMLRSTPLRYITGGDIFLSSLYVVTSLLPA